MKAGFNWLWLPWALLLVAMVLAGCDHARRPEWEETVRSCQCPEPPRDSVTGELPPWAGIRGALLATRFESLEDFKRAVRVRYFTEGNPSDSNTKTAVKLSQCTGGVEISSVLVSGSSQADIQAAKDNGIYSQAILTWRLPSVVAHRADLERVYVLARRLPMNFREGDPSFFDLAYQSVNQINTIDIALRFPKDTTEKGFLNSFNHTTAQAFITTIFSEEVADLVADLHERKNMPELTTGSFTVSQLANPNNNPVENYVDMINNEWGQQIGMKLRTQFGITRWTYWTPGLLANYLNAMLGYYAWAFEVGFKPFKKDDDIVIRFAEKINIVMGKKPILRLVRNL